MLSVGEVKREGWQVFHPLDLSGITTYMVWENVQKDENNVIDRFHDRELCHAIIRVITFKSVLSFFDINADSIVNMDSRRYEMAH
jgi:hypothetical protein